MKKHESMNNLLKQFGKTRKTFHAFVFLLFALTMLCGFPVFAEEAELPPVIQNADDMLDAELRWLKAEAEADAFVWSASKYEQKISEAPSLVTIITSEKIKKFGWRGLPDILQNVGGIYFTYNRNYHYIGVRGFNPPGDLNTRVLLLADGHRINDNVFEQAFIGTDFPIDIDLIDRIEITRGPGSCLYGNNAFFGVINVILKKGKDINGTETSVSAGSYDAYEGRFTYGKKFSHNIDLLISGSAYDSKGDEEIYYKEFDDPSTNNGCAEGNDADKVRNLFLKLSLWDFTLSGVYNSRDKDVPTAAFGTVFNEPLDTIDDRAYGELKYEHGFGEHFNMAARIYYDYYIYKGTYSYSGTDEDSGEEYLYINKDDDVSEWFGGELKLTRNLFGNSILTLGAEFQHNIRQNMFNYDESPYSVGLLMKKKGSESYAVYIQDETRIFQNLIFNGGIRYDRYESFGDTLNPRLSLIYHPLETTSLKLIYGTAFRAPDVYEQYVREWASMPALDPEKITTYEIIAEQNFREGFKGFISYFKYKIDDLISQVTYGDSWTYENTDEIEAEGIELGFQGKWKNGVVGNISYSYQKVKNGQVEDDESDETVSNSPRHLIKGDISVPLIPEKMFASFECRYVSERNMIQDGTVKDYAVGNLTFLWKNVINGLELSASVYNLFDEKYSDPVSKDHEQKSIEQDGRTFRLKLTYKY